MGKVRKSEMVLNINENKTNSTLDLRKILKRNYSNNVGEDGLMDMY